MARPTVDDYIDSLGDQHRARREARQPELRRRVQGVVAMDQLTGHPIWDVYLQHIQGLLQETEAAIDNLMQLDLQASDPSHEALLKVLISKKTLHMRKLTLEELRDLPKRLMQEGETAQKELHDGDSATRAD